MYTRGLNLLEEKICFLLNLVGKVSLKIDDKKRERLLQFSLMLIGICAYGYSALPINVHLLVKCVIGVLIMGAIILFSIDRKIKPVQVNLVIVGLWIGISIFQLIGGVLTSVEYLPMGCVWLVGFPILFLVWNNRQDYEVLFRGIYRGCLYSALFCMIWSMIFIPINSSGYAGVFRGINAISTHASAIFAIILLRILTGKGRKICVDFIGGCLLISFAFFSHSRSIALIIVGIVIVAVCASIIVLKISMKEIFKKSVMLILGSILMTMLVFQINSFSTRIFQHETSQKSNMESVVDGYVSRMEGKDKAGGGIDNYSSGRIGIWKEAISKFKVFGNPSRDHIVTERNGDVKNNTHNQFIQFFYNNGIIVGVLFCIMAVIAFVDIMKQCFKNENKQLYIQVMLIHISYIGLCTFESIDLPFLYELSFIYLMSYVVLFPKNKEKNLKSL